MIREPAESSLATDIERRLRCLGSNWRVFPIMGGKYIRALFFPPTHVPDVLRPLDPDDPPACPYFDHTFDEAVAAWRRLLGIVDTNSAAMAEAIMRKEPMTPNEAAAAIGFWLGQCGVEHVTVATNTVYWLPEPGKQRLGWHMSAASIPIANETIHVLWAIHSAPSNWEKTRGAALACMRLVGFSLLALGGKRHGGGPL